MRLAGTYHPIEYLLLRLEDFFPTLLHSGALFTKEDELLFILNGDKQEIAAFDQVTIQKLRTKRKFHFDWTHSPELLDSPVRARQSSLYDEEKNTTLLIYLPSDKRDLCDVIILTFPSNQVMKGMDKVFSGLSTTDKSLLSSFSVNLLKSEFERIESERLLITGFAQVQKAQLMKIDQLDLSLQETRRLYLNSLRILITEYIQKLNTEYTRVFIATDDLIEKLASLQLGINEIYASIRSAVELGFHLLSSEKEILIPSSYLVLNDTNVHAKDNSRTDSDKVFNLLNRYETSAETVQSKELAINGKNVAKFLDPPVTPPAITDAVKKNEKRIRFLLHQYEDKWQLIRKFLKPIERLDESGSNKMKKAI